MTYKRPYPNHKKYLPHPSKGFDAGTYNMGFSIPMPNEQESFGGFPGGRLRIPALREIIEYIRCHIKLEDIILIGLIILLLDESIEDDFLLILLIYILLF